MKYHRGDVEAALAEALHTPGYLTAPAARLMRALAGALVADIGEPSRSPPDRPMTLDRACPGAV